MISSSSYNFFVVYNATMVDNPIVKVIRCRDPKRRIVESINSIKKGICTPFAVEREPTVASKYVFFRYRIGPSYV